ncbi:hypothetical protein [Isoptericola croceus]|uniref:hypothetical protein n=1 Tax=Isoptericola croceus TaxID=3031406 RepID=UPI0023F75E70|nr:hypothetical protein [Isoptericola croceus]
MTEPAERPQQAKLPVGASSTAAAKGEAPGVTFDVGKLGQGDNAGVDVGFGGGLTFGYGDTWVFDDESQYNDMRKELDTYLMQQEMLKHSGRGGGFATHQAIKSMGGYADPPKDPAITFTQLGGEGSLDASLGLRDPTGTTDANGKDEFFDPNVGANLSVGANGQAIRKVDAEAGTVSWTYELTGSGSVGAEVVAGGGSAEGTTQGAFTVTRDAADDVVKLEFKTMREGGFEGHLGNEATFESAGAR